MRMFLGYMLIVNTCVGYLKGKLVTRHNHNILTEQLRSSFISLTTLYAIDVLGFEMIEFGLLGSSPLALANSCGDRFALVLGSSCFSKMVYSQCVKSAVP